MIFTFYLGAMSVAMLLSLSNFAAGDRRLPTLAVKYFFVISGFHILFMTWLGLNWHNQEFYILVAAAQGVIARFASKIGCRAARIVMPLALIAVAINLFRFVVDEDDLPHVVYYYTMNFVQCAQIASIIFASSVWLRLAEAAHISRRKHNGMKRIAHEPTR